MKTSKALWTFLPLAALLFLAACGDGNPSSPEKEEGLSSVSGGVQAGDHEAGQEASTAPADGDASASAGQEDQREAEISSSEINEKAAEADDPDADGSSGTEAVSGILPVAVEIPEIGVYADIESLGLTDTGAMDVPDDGDLVGWYNRGAKPGAPGNAVLAGHVDDRSGPAVFYDLKELREGDEILVHGEDETLTFIVTRMEAYPYDDAPLQQIFGRSTARNLNLITCTGEFDREQRTHRERLVVYTELKT
ncbi:class F sortase [Alteribacter lacisalsi]|uniref:class F sortase n=1 Tax=Alteribacter lacisalsi TaxID=2045244 RepID=UPI00137529AB|nr:class F sortase [Alteribacter lacisalsi]